MMYDIDYKAIGERIRAERKRQKLTQGCLSEMVEISESFMGHIERGTRTLSIETLVKLANALNLGIEYIICGEYNYQPDMLPADVHDSLKKMNDNQRKVFMSIMKTLADHPDTWKI